MKVTPHRKHPLWLAFFLHRVSGLALALFLPIHFWVLSLALNDAAALDGQEYRKVFHRRYLNSSPTI